MTLHDVILLALSRDHASHSQWRSEVVASRWGYILWSVAEVLDCDQSPRFLVHQKITTAKSMRPLATPVRLKRRFGLFHCVAIIAGIIVGTGVYVAPTVIFLRISSPGLALILWPIGGAISLLSSLVFAELGTTYPECGDAYLYLRIFYGELVSFVEFWQYFFFARTGYNAIKCLLAASWV